MGDRSALEGMWILSKDAYTTSGRGYYRVYNSNSVRTMSIISRKPSKSGCDLSSVSASLQIAVTSSLEPANFRLTSVIAATSFGPISR